MHASFPCSGSALSWQSSSAGNVFAPFRMSIGEGNVAIYDSIDLPSSRLPRSLRSHSTLAMSVGLLVAIVAYAYPFQLLDTVRHVLDEDLTDIDSVRKLAAGKSKVSFFFGKSMDIVQATHSQPCLLFSVSACRWRQRLPRRISQLPGTCLSARVPVSCAADCAHRHHWLHSCCRHGYSPADGLKNIAVRMHVNESGSSACGPVS